MCCLESIHQNFPGQFRSLAPALIKEGYEVHALGEETNIKQVDDYPNLKLHYYKLTRGSTKGIEDLAVEFEAKMLRAKFVAEKCEELKNQGLKPSLIIAHPQWGESFFLKDIWSDTKILSYFEMHWHTENSDIDKGMLEYFGILGPPAYFFYNKNNRIEQFDIQGYLGPKSFVEHVFLLKEFER